MDDAAANPAPAKTPIAALRILASGSSGNCSVLLLKVAGERRICLIDAGISPRRVRRFLEHSGLSMDLIDAVLVTHLDHDHWKDGWCSTLPSRATVRLHARHAAAMRRSGQMDKKIEAFDGAFELHPGIRVDPVLGSHDEHGVAAFRVDFACEADADATQGGAATASLGFATDLGHVPDGLIEHFQGVDVLAIESNYCPRMQQASSRPWFLKRRIMGGSGHLSNEQCLRAVEAIGPRSHVVLLHLSRECNHPDLVAQMHAGAGYDVTVTHHERPTRWVPIHASPASRTDGPGRVMPAIQMSLFGGGGLDGALPGASTAAHG